MKTYTRKEGRETEIERRQSKREKERKKLNDEK